jgi:hypothetical protein
MSFPNISGYRVKKIPTMGQQQRGLYDELYGSVRPSLGPATSQLSQLAQGNQGIFDQLEAPAFRQFKEQLMPRLAEQQTARGGGRSSGYLNRLQGATSNFAQDLQSQRMGLQQNALSQLLGLGQNLMNTQTEQPYLQKKTSTRLLESLAQLMGKGPEIAGGIAKIYAGGGFG